MNRYLYSLLVAMSFFHFAFGQSTISQEQKRTAGEYWIKGQQNIKDHDWQTAIENLTKAIELRPLYLYYDDRGCTYLQVGKYKEAAHDFRMAMLDEDANYDRYYYLAGLAFYYDKNYPSAIKNFKRSLWYNSSKHEAAFQLSLTYYELKKIDSALINVSLAISINPDTTYFKARANMYCNYNQYDLAIADFDFLISQNPNDEAAYSDEGSCYFVMGNYDSAISSLSKSIALNPKNIKSLINRGSSYANKKQYKLAAADFREALRIDPKSEKAKTNLKNCEVDQAFSEH